MRGFLSTRSLGIFALIALASAAAALVSVRLRSSGFRWQVVGSTLAGLDPAWTAAAFAFIILTYVGRALRWRVMIAPVRPHANLRELLSATAVGFTAVVFFGRPGEFVRPWLISVKERVPFSSQLAAWFLERIFDLLGVVLLFGFALTRSESIEKMNPHAQTILRAGGYLALSCGIACVLVLVVAARFSNAARRWCTRLAGYTPSRVGDFLRRSLDSFLDGMQSTGKLGSVCQIVSWTAAEWAVISAAIFFLLRAFSPTSTLSITDALVFTGFVSFGSAVQLPGIGGGMQVAAILVFTEIFALPLEQATAGALLIWIATWLTIVPFGLLFAFREGLRWSNLRNIRERAEPVPDLSR